MDTTILQAAARHDALERYRRAYERANGFPPHSVTYARGWVIVQSGPHGLSNRYRLAKLAEMSAVLESRPAYDGVE